MVENPELHTAYRKMDDHKCIIRVTGFINQVAIVKDVYTDTAWTIGGSSWDNFELHQLEWPKVHSLWDHKNGNRYIVRGHSNTKNDRNAEYPQWVEYANFDTGEPYGRKLVDWYRSMTPAPV